LWGEETDDWMGKKIGLYVTEVEAFGKRGPAIRVKARKPKAAPEPDLFDQPGDPPGTESMVLKTGGVATRQTA
jgi:hypothetical protein